MLLASVITGSALTLVALCNYITLKSMGKDLDNHVGIHSALGYFKE